jgi:hypothetical protein
VQWHDPGITRRPLNATLSDILVLSENTIALGASDLSNNLVEIPQHWVEWIGKQMHRLATVAQDDLGDIAD